MSRTPYVSVKELAGALGELETFPAKEGRIEILEKMDSNGQVIVRSHFMFRYEGGQWWLCDSKIKLETLVAKKPEWKKEP